MARIPMTNGFTVIPEGEHVFRIYEAKYDEDFGKIEIKMVTANGSTHMERYSILNQNGEYNEKVLNAFSYFAKTALNSFDIEDVDPSELINHYVRAEVVHVKAPSTKDPTETVTFVNLGDKSPADGFDTEPTGKALELTSENKAVKAENKTVDGGLDIDALLG
jgi:hypothetical protein